MDAPLLLVGFQHGCLPALRALGRPAFALVGEGGRRADLAEIAGWAERDLHGSGAALEAAARELLGGRTPGAVVALAERTVLVAARLREAFGLPGNTHGVAERCADKLVMKRAMDAAGVRVAPWCEVLPGSRADELVAVLGLPLVLKPRRDSGGRGQAKLTTTVEVAATLEALVRERAFDSGYGWIAEGWIDGVEMSVESFVVGGAPRLHNPTEYYVPRHANVLPAELPTDEWAAIQAFVSRALTVAGVERGMTHLELFRRADELVFGELAVRPPGGRLMTLLKRAWAFDPWEALLRLELGEAFEFPAAPRRTAGVWVLHPGHGTLRALEGVEQARAVPGVRRIALKVALGETIAEREGTGQDIGAIYAEAQTRDEVAQALSAARERLRFELE